MERSARNFVALLLGFAAAAVLLPSSVSAQIAFRSCPRVADLACGHLSVPTNPQDPAAGGTIRLAIRRRRAPVGDGKTAVVALAGGPGQAAIPFVETFEQVLGPILDSRDLIVFDQRGTGVSHPLRCHALEGRDSAPPGIAVDRCARQLGTQRSLFTSEDSVADIEAIRVAGGYEKLVLYGTSYGTKVALEYAQDHPSHVEALILDSVVSPNGPETLDLPTFAAVPRILRQLCDYHDCRGITTSPVGDLRRLVAHLGSGSLLTRIIGPTGRARSLPVNSEDLLEVLVDGDLNPILRAEFPAAVRSALLGDPAALGRLVARTLSGSESGDEGIDVPLYYATSCEEQLFPWSRASTPSARLHEAKAKIGALPTSAFAPFARANVLAASDIRECADWPFATPAPSINDEPLPAVPTVILSGADDLRTPTSGARAIAAKIPGSHLIVVPNTGHSVLTTEPGTCAVKAVRAMFTKLPIHDCKRKRPPAFLLPTPIAPRTLASVPSVHGYRGRPGRTLASVGLTLGDVLRQLVLDLLEGDSAKSLRIGGLRRGWAQLAGGAIELHDYSYVPGVTLSGRIAGHSDTLVVGGRAAARGELRLGRSKALIGRLGDTNVRLAPTAADEQEASIASFGGQDSDRALARAGGAAATSALSSLDGTLGEIRPAAAEPLRAAFRYAINDAASLRAGSLER